MLSIGALEAARATPNDGAGGATDRFSSRTVPNNAVFAVHTSGRLSSAIGRFYGGAVEQPCGIETLEPVDIRGYTIVPVSNLANLSKCTGGQVRYTAAAFDRRPMPCIDGRTEVPMPMCIDGREPMPCIDGREPMPCSTGA